MTKKHFTRLIIIWILIIVVSYLWNYLLITSNNKEVVLNKSKSFFEQILISQLWNSNHGEVYVPITDVTTPNIYLKDTLRDVVTTEGMKLTKINPAFMTRQISELDKIENDLQFHLTSLNPIRPGNRADKWETNALGLFERGTDEILELIKNDSISQYRYMAPLITEKSCLKCHEKQGYKVGDIRGGISISFPSTLYIKGMNKQIVSFLFIHILILGIGISALMMFYRRLSNYFAINETQNKNLKEINATKDKLFSIIAHDLRSPFTGILGLLNILNTSSRNLTEIQKEKFIDEIEVSSKKVFHLLEDLLLWANSQLQKIELKKDKLNLNKTILESIETYLTIIKSKNISFELNICDDVEVYADKPTVKIVISNLFNNSIKFTPKGGNIKIEANRVDNLIEISVSDSGVGIPSEILPKLFVAGENISTLGTNNEKGTGLGLLLCKDFVNKNGGTIWVESRIGKGTKFTFSLQEYNTELV